MNQKIRYFLILSIVFLGITAISSGMIMPSLSVKGKNIVKLKVVQKRVASSNKLELILKNITQDVNVPLSVEVKDYIENIGSVSDKVLAKLKLDTSLVNIKQPGAYQYTVDTRQFFTLDSVRQNSLLVIFYRKWLETKIATG